jgi:hypothetical protein
VTWSAVRAGAAVALAFAIPTALVAQVVDSLADLDDQDPVAAVFFLAVVVGFLAGGYAAGRRAPDRPFIHATAGVVGAYALVSLFALVRLVVGGSDIELIAFVVNAFLASGLGLLGASVAAARNAHASQP